MYLQIYMYKDTKLPIYLSIYLYNHLKKRRVAGPKAHVKISGWARDPLQVCRFLAFVSFLLLTAGVSGSLWAVDLLLNLPVAKTILIFRESESELVQKSWHRLFPELQFPTLPASCPPCASEMDNKHHSGLKNWASISVTGLFP